MIATDPEDRNAEIRYHDDVTTTSTTERERRLWLLRIRKVYHYFVYFRYFPDVDYVSYFSDVPKTPALPRRSPLSGVEPDVPLFPHVCTQTQTPTYI